MKNKDVRRKEQMKTCEKEGRKEGRKQMKNEGRRE